MLALIHFLVHGRFPCEHKWKTVDSCPLTYGGKRVGDCYILECEKCGEVKQRNLIALS